MARIRTIKPEFFRHYDLYMAEVEEKLPLRVAFAGLWTAADKEGRFRWIAEELKLDCLPYDRVDFSRVLNALTTRGFIEKYESNGSFYGWIPGFSRHQVINNKERSSCLPSPLECDRLTREGRVPDACAASLSNFQGEGKGREGKGKEGERNKEQRVMDAWNSATGVIQIRKLDLQRKRHLQSRLAEPNWPWEEAIKKFPLPCCTDGKWTPNFDWFIRPGTADKILEGKYDFNPSNKEPIKKENFLDKRLAEIEEEERLCQTKAH